MMKIKVTVYINRIN